LVVLSLVPRGERALELLWVIKLAVKAMVPSLEQDWERSKEQQQVSDSTTLKQNFWIKGRY
jgi:hypothetical protein